jgi:hypothetical protein
MGSFARGASGLVISRTANRRTTKITDDLYQLDHLGAANECLRAAVDHLDKALEGDDPVDPEDAGEDQARRA